MAPKTHQGLLKSCFNPGCPFYHRASEKAPLKCSKCKSAHYCDKDCQKAHWPAHKEFCKIWAETSANNGEIPVVKIKAKMSRLIWLIRGMHPEYTSYLFKEYLWHKRQGRRGFMEFHFEKFEELFEAIAFVEGLPVTGEAMFCAMPGTPSSRSEPGLGNVPQSIKSRRVPPGKELDFVRIVDDKMHFTENENRPNLQYALDLAMPSDDKFVISVTVQLQGTYSTHLYDFFYKGLTWNPGMNQALD